MEEIWIILHDPYRLKVKGKRGKGFLVRGEELGVREVDGEKAVVSLLFSETDQ